MTRKIIHIYTRSYISYFPDPDSPYYYLAGWASLQAKEVKKKWPEVTQEIWRLEKEVSEVKEKTVEGVVCKLYPAGKYHIKYDYFPFRFIRDLIYEAKENQVIFNLHFQHSIRSIILLYILRNAPVVLHHHGGVPFRHKKRKSFFKRIVNYFLSLIEEHFLKKVDFFSVISNVEKEYLENYAKSKNVTVEQGRKYFEDIQPVDKVVAREKLNIPDKAKVLIYVGHYYKLKGVDVLLSVFNELKTEDSSFELIMIGGLDNSENDLYSEVKKTNVFDFGRVDNDQMPLYYSAADVYIFYSENQGLVNYGGIGTAPVEAMACNVPIVSKQLIHYSGNDLSKIGEIPESRDDLKEKILKVIANKEQYNPRETARKYYDFGNIIEGNIKEYKKIFCQYYPRITS